MSVRVTFRGKPLKAPQVASKVFNKLIPKEMTRHAHGAIAKALPITPIDLGDLRSSWFVGSPQRKRHTWVVPLGFKASHAWVVHENLNAWHDAPTMAKFLEVGARRYGLDKKVPRDLRRMVKRALKLISREVSKGSGFSGSSGSR